MIRIIRMKKLPTMVGASQNAKVGHKVAGKLVVTVAREGDEIVFSLLLLLFW